MDLSMCKKPTEWACQVSISITWLQFKGRILMHKRAVTDHLNSKTKMKERSYHFVVERLKSFQHFFIPSSDA